MNKPLTLAALFLLAGCVGTPPVTNHESVGNLATTSPLACVSTTQVIPTNSAADVAAGARECVRQSRYDEAAELIMVASAYAHFDTQRVADKSAHSALNALFVKEFGSLPEAERNRLFASIDALDSDRSRKSAICSQLLSAPPPSYFPGYMVAHGMGAFTGSDKEPLIKDFNAPEAWSRSMAFIKCNG